MRNVLGIDFGGVILDRKNISTDVSFIGNRYLEATAVEDAFDAIRELGKQRFGKRIYIVSRCKEVYIEQRTRDWLAHNHFSAHTGITPACVHFCRQRHEKFALCQTLGITHFIDDRLEVLGYLQGVVRQRYLFQPDPEEVTRFEHFLLGVIVVSSWREVLRHILCS